MTTLRLLLFAILFQVSSWACAQQQKQDVIIKRNGDKLSGHVTQISDKEIFYGEENMPANVFRTVPLADVAAILYGDGKVQTFAAPTPPPCAHSSSNSCSYPSRNLPEPSPRAGAAADFSDSAGSASCTRLLTSRAFCQRANRWQSLLLEVRRGGGWYLFDHLFDKPYFWPYTCYCVL